MIDFKDVTFIMPVRFDSEDRRRNFKISTEFLLRNFDTNIIVMESDKTSNEEFVKSVSEDIHYMFDENRDKFGDEMVVYRCHAHGQDSCTNDVLAKIFKQHGIQVPKLSKKGLMPDIFPPGDDTYLNVNRLNERPHYKFKGLEGETNLLLTEMKDKKTGKAKLLPLSYSKFETQTFPNEEEIKNMLNS